MAAVSSQLLTQIHASIVAIGLTGILDASIRIRKIPVEEPAWSFPYVMVYPISSETMNPDAGTNQSDDIGYPIGVTMVAADNMDPSDTNLAKYLKWREDIARTFRNQRISGVAESIRSWIEPGLIREPPAWLHNRWNSRLVVRAICREPRTLGV